MNVTGQSRWLLPAICYVAPGSLAVTALASEPIFRLWMQEDAWVEWATFLLFACAAVLFARSVPRVDLPAGRRLAQGLLSGAALFCFFVAGEEISWGQRLLGYTPPDYFLEHNFQQELNFHNLLTKKEVLGVPTDSRYLVALIAIAYGVVGPALARLFPWIRPAAPPLWLSPLLIAIAVVELTYPVSLTGEAAEFALGVAFCAAPASQSTVVRTASIFASIAIAPLLVLGLSLVHAGDEERSRRARVELEAIGRQITAPGVLDPKLQRRRSVHKRIYTAQEAGYFQLEDGGFFIDPWGSPYWLSARRGRQTLWLYSFGPNRRRDLDVKKAESDPGDDVLVEVPLVRR